MAEFGGLVHTLPGDLGPVHTRADTLGLAHTLPGDLGLVHTRADNLGLVHTHPELLLAGLGSLGVTVVAGALLGDVLEMLELVTCLRLQLESSTVLCSRKRKTLDWALLLSFCPSLTGRCLSPSATGGGKKASWKADIGRAHVKLAGAVGG